MRAAGFGVHEGGLRRAVFRAPVEAGVHVSRVCHTELLQAEDLDGALLLADAELARLLLALREEIFQLFVVDLQEACLDDKHGLVGPLLDLAKDKLNDARDYPSLFILQADRVARAHGPGLATARLAVREESGIDALQAAVHKVADALVEHLLLLRILVKNGVKREMLVGAEGNGGDFRRDFDNARLAHFPSD